jgi:hypothetical protein
MQNDDTTASDSAQPERDMVGQDETVAARPGKHSAADGFSEPDRPQRRARTDKGKLHARHHGVLSRNPLTALIGLGENPRHLQKIKKMLRAELKPIGILGEILFDRAWSSYLRCLLIARTEAHLFMPVDQGDSKGMPQLKEMELPTLIFPEPCATNYRFSDDLMKRLETALRYDAHYAREFYRAVAMLIASQSGGLAGFLDCL